MITIKRIDTIDEVISLWPKILADKPERFKTSAQFLQALLTSLDHGLFIAYVNNVYAGFCLLNLQGKIAVLCFLPSSGSTQVGLRCLQEARHWAKAQGARYMNVTTTKFSGATRRYFEGLGFKQYAVTYSTRT